MSKVTVQLKLRNSDTTIFGHKRDVCGSKEVHFMSGSEVSIATVTSNCYSGGRNNSPNSEDSDLIDSSKIQERNQKMDFDSISFRKTQIIVSPNPFTSTVSIEISLEDISFTFELQNQLGEILRSCILKNGKNTLNFSELPNGIYIVYINSGNKFLKHKLIKI